MILYVMAISFQLIGAVFLVSNFLTKKEDLVKSLEENEAIIHWGEIQDDGKSSITYTVDELNEQAEKNYKNIYALLLIILGYLFGIFGEKGDSVISFVAVIVLSLILYFAGNKICKYLAKNRFKDGITIKDK